MKEECFLSEKNLSHLSMIGILHNSVSYTENRDMTAIMGVAHTIVPTEKC